MGSKYTSQTVSGFNSAPPSDDGSTASSNQVLWNTIKTKLADPLNVAIAAVNSALVTANDFSMRSVTSADSTVAGDHMRTLQVPSTVTTTFTISLADAATMTNGYIVRVRNSSQIGVTIGRDSVGDTLDGAASNKLLPPGATGVYAVNAAANGYVTLSYAGPVQDTDAIVAGGTDGTKKVRLEVDGLTTATTRVLTVQDADGALAYVADITGGARAGSFTTGTFTRSGVGDAITFSGGGTTGYVYTGASIVGIFAGAGATSSGVAVGASGSAIYSPSQANIVAVNNTGTAITGLATVSGVLGVGNASSSSIQCYITGSGTKIHFLVDGTNGQPIYSGTNSQTFTSGESATASALFLRKDGTSGRSLSSAGTNNASGADYAEYERKSASCGVVAKGQIIGFDADGKLTDKWSLAKSFGVKSTDPGLVGGDTWGNEDALGLTNPKQPEPPLEPGALAEEASEEDVSEHDAAVTKYADDLSAYNVAFAQYTADKAVFDAALEAARQTVDRIAYSGKVPVNVTGANPGDYIIAVQDGDGISGQVVSDPDFAQYKKAVGRVRRILADGRAEVAVMVQ
jgi:hypothetical protein